MNRHGQRLTNFTLSKTELSIFSSNKGWNVLNGEWMNKSQKDENNELFNHKFVLFDYLVHDGDYLIGKTFDYRYNLMVDKFDTYNYNEYLNKITDNIFLVKSFNSNFSKLFNDFIKIDMLEGLVLKRNDGRLERGSSQKNNIKSQIKCRKESKNYKY
jgi:ATP-dependent DNA ligase